MKFELILSPQAVRDLDKLNENIYKKIIDNIQVLAENPFPRGKLIKKLKSTRQNFYRSRTDKHRVFYIIEKEKVVLLRILDKKDTDRFIKNI